MKDEKKYFFISLIFYEIIFLFKRLTFFQIKAFIENIDLSYQKIVLEYSLKFNWSRLV